MNEFGEVQGGKEPIRKPLLYENSPDGGAFLASQPVPRCGAFCYLAVVSRDTKNEGWCRESEARNLFSLYFINKMILFYEWQLFHIKLFH